MRTTGTIFSVCLVLFAASAAMCLEGRAFLIRDDFGTEALEGCALNYYYYIPCPTYSWFWSWSLEEGDVVGKFFSVGDISMSGQSPCDPATCHSLERITVLEFTGTGPIYCGLASAEIDVYCADASGCPVGPPLWSSGPRGTNGRIGWSEIPVEPPLCLTSCLVDPSEPLSGPRILITWTMTNDMGGSCPSMLCTDNVGRNVESGCDMHDIGCVGAVYPRPYNSHYATVHSGYFGKGFEYCPPLWFKDELDTTQDGTQYGYCELAWRIHLGCLGPTGVQPSTWGGIKSMYR